jgi:porin
MTEGTFAPADSATRFKAGVWLHTANFADLRDDASGQPFALTGRDPRQHASNHGAYAVIERTLAGEPGKAGHLELFVRGGFSPADRNAISWALDTGLGWTGPIPGRPDDVAALGLAHAAFGSHFAAGAHLADPSVPSPDFEQVIEAAYTIKLSAHLRLQPDLQFIRHPGGSAAQRTACVALVRLCACF